MDPLITISGLRPLTNITISLIIYDLIQDKIKPDIPILLYINDLLSLIFIRIQCSQ